MGKMQNIILQYKKLNDRVESRENSKAEREKVFKNIEEIAADFSEIYIKTFQKVLDASLPKLYDGINYDDSKVDLKELVKDNSVVLVPNHQSHVDYLAINYMFYKSYKKPLYVAGGNNLNIFPIGKLFRKSGCFFIRRSFQNDITYKLTLEAYLYYLLKEKKPIEFFFEGGRSRTGKLLPPRYGLYGMLLDAYQQLKEEEPERKLYFVPVSIAHEYVPEQKSLAKELGGAKKKKESTTQLFGLFKLFAYQFGSVHIKCGEPIKVMDYNSENLKSFTQDLAFQCFRRVGKNMMVTPTSLLALILLDEATGAMTWQDIINNAKAILEYCNKFDVPITDSLKDDKCQPSLERAMDILVGNKRINVIGREHHGTLYYSIREECRQEILYFKNTILHHFLVPSIISYAWINLFNGGIVNVQDLKDFFLEQRNQLKHEFYLPTVKQFFLTTLKVISDAIGRKVESLEDMMELSHKELYAIASKVGIFTRALSYINEGYYASALTVRSLMKEYPEGFKMDSFNKKVKSVFEAEKELGRVIRYSESFSLPLTKNSIKYMGHQNLLNFEDGHYKVDDSEKLDSLINSYEKGLTDQLTFNFRAPSL
ncbi:1-acyl-sn-glycerol-3-phosphate acyltransferase [Bacteriovoracaceae bacterium]|nr:1-acyl-sn-glycerol-3-phosphate acyltransferase [Bacteriovoracaceae bacterium]